MPRGQEPQGRVLMRYEIAHCVDRAGQSSNAPPGAVWLVRVPEGGEVLVRTTPGYDSIVITSEHAQGEERVFQLSMAAGPEQDVLLDYRLPVLGEGPGRFAIVRTWQEQRGGKSKIVAHFEQVARACLLAPAPSTSGRLGAFRLLEPPWVESLRAWGSSGALGQGRRRLHMPERELERAPS